MCVGCGPWLKGENRDFVGLGGSFEAVNALSNGFIVVKTLNFASVCHRVMCCLVECRQKKVVFLLFSFLWLLPCEAMLFLSLGHSMVLNFNRNTSLSI